MDRRTKQLIEKVYLMFLRRDGCHFERREKSVPLNSLIFLSRRLLRNDNSIALLKSILIKNIINKKNMQVTIRSSTSLGILAQYHNMFLSFQQYKNILQSFFIFISLSFLISCANQLPPGGGEIDLMPPAIVSSFPMNGTTNFSENYFELEFSEYVDKRSFKDAVFISPVIEGGMDVSWSGKSVTVEFPNGFKKDITYVVNIGTDVVDLNNKNRMAQSFSFSFSTGDRIDRRSISGKVFGNEIDGTMIFGYKNSSDTTNYLAAKPDYLSQVGKDGSYVLNGLAESIYRVFAVKDQFRDLLFQPDQDLIGVAFKDISLVGSDSSYSGLNFFLFKADTVKPRLLSSVMTDRNHIFLTISEEVDSSVINSQNFYLIDSTFDSKVGISYIFKGDKKKEELVLTQSEILNPEHSYYLIANELKDLNGNIFLNDATSLIQSEKPDTTSIKIIRTIPAQKSLIDFKNTEVLFYFDDAFSKESVKDAIQFADTSGKKIPFKISYPDDAKLSIKPSSDLKPEKHYEVKLDLSKFSDPAGNKTDSVYRLNFSTINGIEFTGVSGRIRNAKDNLVLVLQNTKDQSISYVTKADKTSTYSFERIEAGSYTLWYYFDKDSSGTYDHGWLYPFRNSEEFNFYKDTLKLRPRWGLTDVDIKIE